MNIPNAQKGALDPTRVIRQQRYADSKRKNGMKKYSFWLNESSAIVVRSVATLANADGNNSVQGVRFDEMVNTIANTFNCDNAEAVMMALTRTYASLKPLSNEFDYPSQEARAGMAAAESGGAVISSKTLADVLGAR